MNERDIFDAALAITDSGEQAAYLDGVCGDDVDQRSRLQELLDAQQRLGSFLDSPPAGVGATIDQPITEKPGTQIGPYKLLQKVGEGGMGVVYMAEQKEPVKRRVALKIIKPGMDTRQVIARFEAERQALAMMDHPNIAKVLDAGQTESGRPYFVMELVKGMPVTQYCDEQHLTPKERLELFVPICQAVQHAHQKGVIHRDLKPSNILIALYDGQTVPKVIDFGVAKATGQTLTEKTMFTQLGQVVGTLEYMSPEQAQVNQLDVDTRSDIYSLGVVLYELLTGDTPFDRQRLRSAAFDEMLRIIREEEPQKPSTKLSSSESLPSIAANRHIEPQKLSTLVRGELDWIVMKALEKDRARRYETASKFVEDVQHYLNDEAVVACPPSAGYRFRKFARRNKVAFVTSSLVASALVLGLLGTSWQAVRATDEAKRANQAERLAQTRLENEQRERRRAEQAEAEAKSEAARANAETVRAAGNLDLALASLDAVYLDGIGEEKLLGEPAAKPQRPQLGADDRFDEFGTLPIRPKLTDLERKLLKRGLEFYDQFAQQNATAPRAFLQTAEAYYRVGLLQSGLGDAEAASESFQFAVERFEQLTKAEPDNAEQFRKLAKAYTGLANVVPEWSRAKKALEDSRLAYSSAIELKPNDVSLYLRRGDVRNMLSDRQAVEDYEKALALDPNNVQGHLKCSSYYLSGPNPKGDIDKSRQHADRAVTLAPEDPQCHLQLAHVCGRAVEHIARGSGHPQIVIAADSKAALEHYARAIELAPDRPVGYRARGEFYASIGEYQRALTDLNRAFELNPDDIGSRRTRALVYVGLEQFDKVAEDLEAVIRAHPNDGTALRRLAGIHMQSKDWQAAVDLQTKVLEIKPLWWFVYKGRAKAYCHLGRHSEAFADLEKALELNPNDTSTIRGATALLLLKASPDFRESLLELANSAVEHSPVPAEAYADRGALYSKLEEYEKADVDFAKAVELDPKAAGAWYRWGGSYGQRGLEKEAREKYSKAIEAKPDHYIWWQSRGVVSSKLEDFAAAVEDFNKALELYPSNPVALSWRCGAFTQLGQLDKAREDCAALLESPRSHFYHYHHALLCLALNDEAKYRESCETMCVRLANTEDPRAANFAAWTCSLTTDAVDDCQPAIALAAKAVEAEPASDQFLNTLGSILFRAGRHDEAIERLTELDRRLENPDHEAQTFPAYNWYFLAMVHKRAGNDGQSEEYLQKATKWTNEVLGDKEHPVAWNHQVTLQILRKEAEALVRTDDQGPADNGQKPERESDTKTEVGQDQEPD